MDGQETKKGGGEGGGKKRMSERERKMDRTREGEEKERREG